MKYTYSEAVQIGVFAAGVILMLVTLISALTINEGKYRKERALFSTVFLIINMVMLTVTLCS
jgi:hypothetical protein